MSHLRRVALFVAVLLPGSLAVCAQENSAQPLKPMARNANPEFEVATIKPADPDDRNQGYSLKGRRMSVQNSTLTDLICFAYSIHKSQVINAPHWFEERWNISGVPDIEGTPDWNQYRRMLQKLLSTRFGLQMHRDKRELSVYTLNVDKGGPKLEKSKSDPAALSDSSGHGIGAQQYMKFTNVSMTELSKTMQLMVDRPVVDQTKLADRYDFSLLWTPDTLRAEPTDTAPGLFTAVQEQLRLKLEATRTATEVFVVDAAVRPTQS